MRGYKTAPVALPISAQRRQLGGIHGRSFRGDVHRVATDVASKDSMFLDKEAKEAKECGIHALEVSGWHALGFQRGAIWEARAASVPGGQQRRFPRSPNRHGFRAWGAVPAPTSWFRTGTLEGS
jgi:hypothetical protein